MVGRVLRIAAEAFPDSPLFVSVEDFALVAAEPTVARLHAEGRLTPVGAEGHIVDSVIEASRTTGFPLILCTADNVLMTVEGFRAIAEAGSAPGVDGVVMMAERKDILAAHPDGQRRFYRFRGGAYSNCNLFWITGEHSFRGNPQLPLRRPVRQAQEGRGQGARAAVAVPLPVGPGHPGGHVPPLLAALRDQDRAAGREGRPTRHRRRQRAHPPGRRGDTGAGMKILPELARGGGPPEGWWRGWWLGPGRVPLDPLLPLPFTPPPSFGRSPSPRQARGGSRKGSGGGGGPPEP